MLGAKKMMISNNKNKLLMIAVMIVALLLSGCAKNPQDKYGAIPYSNPAAIKQEITSSHNTYSILMPADWKEVQHASNIIIYLPLGSSMDDSFSEKYSMIVSFLPENNTRSLEDLTNEDMQASKGMMPGFEVIGEYRSARLGSLDGLEARFKMRVQDRDIEATQLRAIQGNRIYAFTQQCAIGECKHTAIFSEMAGSFEWKNP